MTEAELLDLAGAYKSAAVITDSTARVGLKALSDLRVQGVDLDLIAAALDAHLSAYRAALAAEHAAFDAVQRARTV